MYRSGGGVDGGDDEEDDESNNMSTLGISDDVKHAMKVLSKRRKERVNDRAQG